MSGKSDPEFSIAVCAGGTGGHLFPAEALSAELKRRGHRIILLTDERGLKFGEKFPCDEIAQISSSTLSPRAPLKALTGIFRIISGIFEGFKALKIRVCVLLPVLAAIQPCRRWWPPGFWACRHVCMSKMRCWGGRTDFWRGLQPFWQRVSRRQKKRLKAQGCALSPPEIRFANR